MASVFFPDISFRDEGSPDFILRRWLGGHVFATSVLLSLWPRRVSYSCSSCAQARNLSLRLSFIGMSLVSILRNVSFHCRRFVSLLLRLFASLFVHKVVGSFVCLFALASFFIFATVIVSFPKVFAQFLACYFSKTCLEMSGF